MQFGVQASIHMASSINLIPTKGMTLPFISYGGSSLLASGLTIGLILALTRKRIGQSYTPPSDRPTSNRRERGAA
jgi:cell division protein FtsW